jgi:hypothetical protein
MKLSTLRAGVALLPLLFAVPAIAQQATTPAKPAEAAPAAPAQPAAPAPAAPAAQAQPPAAQGQQAPTPKEFLIDAGGWKGGAFANPNTRQFSYCGIQKVYDAGLTLVFQMNPNYNFNLAVLKQGWGLKEGDKGQARIRVDATYDKKFDAVPGSPEAYVVPTGQNGDLFQALAKGSKAIVTTPKGEFTFPLSGTLAGLNALRDCNEAARKLIASAQGAAPAGGGAPAAANNDPRALIGAQGFGMPVGALQDTLHAAGLENVAIADPRKLPRDPLQINQAWQVGTDGKVVGGLHQEPRGDAIEIDQFAKRYLEIMKSVCATDWQSSDQPSVVNGPYAIKRAELSCKMGEQAISASLVFTLDDNYYTAFFHQSLLAEKSLSEDASKKLGDFIEKQMALVEEKAKQEGSQGAAPAAPTDQPAPAAAPAAPATPPADGQAAPAAPTTPGG